MTATAGNAGSQQDQLETTPAAEPHQKKALWVHLFDAVMAAAVITVGILLLVCNGVPALMGAQSMVVLSGSMAPAIPVGHRVISQPVDVDTLQVGDVITYQHTDNKITNGVPIMHRVQELVTDNGHVLALITKGDANSGPDKPITPNQVTGKIIYTVPYVGHLSIAFDPHFPALPSK
jgi:signal peptidase